MSCYLHYLRFELTAVVLELVVAELAVVELVDVAHSAAAAVDVVVDCVVVDAVVVADPVVAVVEKTALDLDLVCIAGVVHVLLVRDLVLVLLLSLCLVHLEHLETCCCCC